MAITILLEPKQNQPVYNEIITVLNSTLKTKEEFQFVVDVVVNGTTQTRLKIEPNPQGYAVVDLHKHIEPFVSYDINHDSTKVFNTITNSFTPYSISLSEEYIPTIDITSITASTNGFVTVVTASTNGFAVNDSITILNADPSTYDGVYNVTQVDTTTQFEILAQYTTDSTSGEVRLTNEPSAIFSDAATFSETKYAFNGVLNWIDVPNWDDTSYEYGTTGLTNRKLLTSIPNTRNFEVTSDTRMWFNFINNNDMNYMLVNSYDSTGSLLNTTKFANSTSGQYLNVGVGAWNIAQYPNTLTINSITNTGGIVTINTDQNHGLQVPDIVEIISPIENGVSYEVTGINSVTSFDVDDQDSINGQSATSGFIITPNTSTILTGASKYDITLFDTNGDSSNTYTFKIIDDCSKYEVYQFIYLDRLGSFISVSFNRVNKKNVTIEKSSYKKNWGSYNATTNTWGYDSSDRGKTRLDTKVNEVITVNSNWVTEEQSAIIDLIYASPEVYHLDESGNLFAIDILKTNYEVYQRKNGDIYNHTFSFEYSYKNPQQR